MKIILRIETAAKAVLILWFVMAMYLQHSVGLADNCDFIRSTQWITSGPIGIETNWSEFGTEEWSMRFFKYWIPYWKLEWNMTSFNSLHSSAILLWFPGALLSYLFYSQKILYLPTLSLFPKLILLGVLWLLFKWIGLQPKHRLFLILGLGLPITLLFTTTDYVAYFNSFYQEAASFIFLFLFLASIIILKWRPFPVYLGINFALLLCLATSKASNGYWPLIAIPFIFYVWSLSRKIKLRMIIMACLTLILICFFFTQFISGRRAMRNNPYNSLFYGVLTFSDNPSEHLQRLGLEGARRCIDSTSFYAIGIECFAKYQDQMTYQNTFEVIYHEPAVIFKSLLYALDNMQEVNLDYLGKYAFDDPRNGDQSTWMPLLNLWSSLKSRFFPVGYALAFVLLVFTGWFIFSLKKSGFYQDLAIVGLIATMACLMDLIVAILGDGKQELIKHLFLANVLFDVAVIVFLNGVLLLCLEFIGKKRNQNRNLLSPMRFTNKRQSQRTMRST